MPRDLVAVDPAAPVKSKPPRKTTEKQRVAFAKLQQEADLRNLADWRLFIAQRIAAVAGAASPVALRLAEAHAIVLGAGIGWQAALAALAAVEQAPLIVIEEVADEYVEKPGKWGVERKLKHGRKGWSGSIFERWRHLSDARWSLDLDSKHKIADAVRLFECVVHHGIAAVVCALTEAEYAKALGEMLPAPTAMVLAAPSQAPQGPQLKVDDGRIDVAIDTSGPLPRLLLSERMMSAMAVYGVDAVEAALEHVLQEVTPRADQVALKLAVHKWLVNPSGLSEAQKAIKAEKARDRGVFASGF